MLFFISEIADKLLRNALIAMRRVANYERLREFKTPFRDL